MSATRPEVLVLGAGIAGLASAVRLAEAGFPVRVVSKDRPEATTSAVAAALWHPFHAEPPDRVLRWCRASFAVYEAEAGEPGSGVRMRPLVEYHRRPAAWPSWAEAVPDLRRVPPPPGFAAALACTVPVAESPVYLRRLEARLARLGVPIEAGVEVGHLREVVRPGRVVVVCTGLGSQRLLDDAALYPIRGQIVLVDNPGLDRVVLDEDDADALTYLIPRSDDVIVGGTTLRGVWNTEPDPATTEAILERAVRLEPRLAAAAVRAVRVGLRPGRTAVRLEAERWSNGGGVVYNLGHGGSGYTLAWGCADEVVDEVRALVADG